METAEQVLSRCPMTLDGAELSSYTVVYGVEETGYLREFAEWIRDAIGAVCGAEPALVGDDHPAVAREILVGCTNRPETAALAAESGLGRLSYRMGMKNGKYVIAGSGLYTVMRAVELLRQRILSAGPLSEETEGEDLNGARVPHADGSDLRVMSHNIMAVRHAKTWFREGNMPMAPKRVEILQAVLDAYCPDVVGYQEACDGWRDTLEKELDPLIWGFMNPGRSDGSNGETIFVYNKNRLTLLEGGPISYPEYAYTSRVVYAKFALKTDPEKQFLVFNTHWAGNARNTEDQMALTANMEKDFMAALIRRMVEEHGGIPAFTTGDYNTFYLADHYHSFMEISGLTDSFELAKSAGTTVNICGGCSRRSGNRSETPLSESIDHLFCSKQTRVLRYETVTGLAINELSDHSPRYIDVAW